MSSQLEITTAAADSIPHKYPMDSVPLLDDDTSPTKPPPTLSFENDDVEAVCMPCCRICLETDTHGDELISPCMCKRGGDELISPCMCKGTQQFVHRSCLDNWRSVKEGFAFTHCTTCRAQYHLQVAGEEVKSWSKIKFRFFVARDVFLVFLLVQAVIAAFGWLAYTIDKNSDHILPNHPVPLYYSVGFLILLVLVGVIGLLVHCYSARSTSTSSDQHGASCNICVSDFSFLESESSDSEAFAIVAVVCIVLLAMFGIAYGVFAFSMLFQRIWQRHHHIIAKRELTKEYVVVDLMGQYTLPTLDAKHEEHLRALKLL